MLTHDELVQRFFDSDLTWNYQYEFPHEIGRAALDAIDRAREKDDKLALLKALLSRIAHETRFGSPEIARKLLPEAKSLARKLSDKLDLFRIDFLEILIASFEGKGPETIPRALALLKRGGDKLPPFETAQLNASLALEYMSLEDRDPEMLRHFFLTLQELDRVDCPGFKIQTIANLALAQLNLGNVIEAKRLFEETFVMGASHPSSMVLPLAASNYILMLADMEATEDDFRRAKPFLADMSNMPNTLRPFVETAHAYLRARRGDAPGAEESLAVAEDLIGKCRIADEGTQNSIQSEILWVYGLVAELRGDKPAARSLCKRALDLLEGLDDPEAKRRLYSDASRLAGAMGDYGEAYEYLSKAVTLEHTRLGLSLKSMALTMQIQYELSKIKEERDKAVEEANHDSLTKLPNRRLCEFKLAEFIERNRDGSMVLSVCVLDLDRFKQVNDERGHDSGDVVLVEFARELSRAFRDRDFVARWGGEEFVILLPETNANVAKSRLEKFLETFSARTVQLWDGIISGITFSAGVVEFPANETEASSLIRTADKALYEAKGAGRARVVTAAKVAGRLPPEADKPVIRHTKHGCLE